MYDQQTADLLRENERLQELIREHVDTVMPRDGSLVSHSEIASACERLWRETFDARS